MTTTKNNEHKKLNFSSEREQSQVCLNSAEHEKNQGRKVLNVPNLRFKEFQGEWEKCKLGDKCDLLCGYAFDGKDIVEQGTYLLMRGINITEGRIRHSAELDRYYTGSVNKLTKYKLTTGDLVIGMDGSKVGRNSAIVSPKENGSYLVQRVCRIKSCIGNDLILQLVNNHKFHKYVDMVKTSSAIPHISLKDIQNFPIAVPSVQNEADKISKLFHLLDERIATQNKIIDKLQSLIKGISNIIFASIQGREYRMGEIATITNGDSNVQDAVTEPKEGMYPFFDRSEDIKYLPTFLFDKEALIYPGEGAEFMPRYIKGKFALHQRCYAIFDFEDIVNVQFLYFYLKTQNSYFIRNAVGSTVPSLRLDTFQKLKVIIPPKVMQRKVSLCLSSIEQKCNAEKVILQSLLKQKQYLLRQMFI